MLKEQKVRALAPQARTAPSLTRTIQALRRIRDPHRAVHPTRRPQRP